jgi:hypothetical protein
VHLDARVRAPEHPHERHQEALQGLGGRPDAQDAGRSACQRVPAFHERVGIGEQRSSATQKVLALRGQLDAPADPIEEAHAELALEVTNLSSERGLRHAQAERRLRDAPRIDDRGEVAKVPQLHLFPCLSSTDCRS